MPPLNGDVTDNVMAAVVSVPNLRTGIRPLDLKPVEHKNHPKQKVKPIIPTQAVLKVNIIFLPISKHKIVWFPI